MSFRCPGLARAGITATTYPCPACGAEVEMFSDERSVRCPKCRTEVKKDKVTGCRAWCSACTGQRPTTAAKDKQKEA